MPTGKHLNKEQRGQIIEAYLKNRQSCPELAKQFNYSRSAIYNSIKAINKSTQLSITEDVKREIANEYLAGKTCLTIAKERMRSQRFISSQLRKIGISVSRRKINESQRKVIVDNYVSGLPTTEIGRNFNLSATHIAQILKEEGVEIRKGRVFSQKERDEVVSLYVSGLQTAVVAKRLNITTQQVRVIVRSVGKTRTLKDSARSGQDCHLWKGGISKLNNLIRALPQYRIWRQSVFIRDNFICQHCHSKTKQSRATIEADHIYGFAKIIKEFNINSLEDALVCSRLWDIENGRTLCKSCHKKTDNYGRKSA
ncbi:hypothetical protein GCM10028808_73190 [Spirosoma migulaei]